MFRSLAIASLFVSGSAFAAANLATKPATTTSVKTESKTVKAHKGTRTTTTTSATTSTKSTTASIGHTGKSSLVVGEVRPSSRPFKIVPSIGVASFRMQGAKFNGVSLRADQGLALGVAGDFKLSPGFVFEGGLSYYQLGAKGNVDGLPVSLKAKIDYVAINAAGKFYVPGTQVYGKTGLATMFNTRSDFEAKGPGGTARGKLHNVRDMDLMLQLGGGIELPVQQGVEMGAELTWNRGLIDVSTAGNGTVYNDGFMFTGFVTL